MNVYFKGFPSTKGESDYAAVSRLNSMGLGCSMVKHRGNVHLVVTPEDMKDGWALKRTVNAIMKQKKKLGEEYKPKNMAQFNNLQRL